MTISVPLPSDAVIDRTARVSGPGDTDTDRQLALYVHWPFCISKCPYCDFNSHVRQTVDHDLWRNSLLRDLAHEAEVTAGRTLTSIFFGGGTPSLMPPETVAAIIAAAQRSWDFGVECEITLEANPSSVEAARFADLASAGVNRVSLGLQALDEDSLRFLGRAHDVQEGLMALGTAQSAFERVSFDLIYALPGQSLADWESELGEALSFGTDHLSLYQLTIEPGTRFAAMSAKGELDPMDADEAAVFYELTQQLTTKAGLAAYEISNHSRPGQESRHNLAYWRYRNYAGIGPGAHGRRNFRSTRRHRKPENWLSALARNGHGIEEERVIAPRDRGVEALLMGLRLSEGVDLGRIAGLAETDVDSLLDRRATARLESQYLLEREGDRLRVTQAGRLLLDSILAEVVRVD